MSDKKPIEETIVIQVDELLRLRRERDEAKDALIDALRNEATMKAERDEARAELEQLRGLAGDCFGRNSELLAERDEARTEARKYRALHDLAMRPRNDMQAERDAAVAREKRAMSRSGEYERLWQRCMKEKQEIIEQRDALRRAVREVDDAHEARLDALQDGRDARPANEALRLAIEAAVSLAGLEE